MIRLPPRSTLSSSSAASDVYKRQLKDYLEATGDMETVKDLWPVAKKQLDIVRTNVKADGLMDFEKVKKDWWVFFDWKEDLYKEAPLQGVSIFALKAVSYTHLTLPTKRIV